MYFGKKAGRNALFLFHRKALVEITYESIDFSMKQLTLRAKMQNCTNGIRLERNRNKEKCDFLEGYKRKNVICRVKKKGIL